MALIVPNMDEPSKPLIMVNIPNSITLTPTNYLQWKTQVESVLIGLDLFDKHIDGTFPLSSTTILTPAYQTWFRQDKLIFGALIGTISYDHFPLVSQAKTTHELWDILTQTYDKPKPKPTQGKSIENNVNEGDQKDLISNLPNDILIHMLSFMDIKTAGRTSLLSKRWRYVWTQIIDLDLNDPESYVHRKQVNDSQVRRFCTMVNKVITANCAPFLNSFRIHFPLVVDIDKFNSSLFNSYQIPQFPRLKPNVVNANDDIVDNWMNFALTKKVRSLELIFSNFCGIHDSRSYTIRPVYNDHQFNTLQSLHLEGLQVDGPVLENVLAHCHNLDCLTARALKLKYPTRKLVVSSVNLKHLDIRHCEDIRTLKISAPKLTSFVLFAYDKINEVEYTNVSSLVNVALGDGYCVHILHNLHLISAFSHRLEKLSIYWSPGQSSPEYGYGWMPKDNLLGLISFIEACPLLHTFKLELWPMRQQAEPMSLDGRDVTIKHEMRKHDQLKVLEIVGFDGSASVAELVFCVAENAPMLKKIICDPHCPRSKGGYLHKVQDIHKIDRIALARRQAKLLPHLIQQSIDVVVL